MKINIIYALLLTAFTSLSSFAQQTDLAIEFANYTEGEKIGYGNILTEFHLINRGTNTIPAGDTVLLASKFNSVVYDMYLRKKDSVTFWKLADELKPGDTLTLNPGFLIGYAWANGPQWRVPDGSLKLTLMVYGVGRATWKNPFVNDANPADNQTSIVYDNVDLSVQFTKYLPNEVTKKSAIDPSFIVINRGPVDIKQGQTLFMRATLNDSLYSLALVPKDTTKFLLTADFKVGDTLSFNPGPIDAASTAFFLGRDTLKLGILVYGVGRNSVAPNFRADGNPADNRAIIKYDSKVKDNLAIKFADYTEGQYLGYGNIETKFHIINNGPTTLHAGDTVLLAAKFNDTVFDMYLNKKDSVTFWKLSKNIPVGDTLTLNPGYLEGHSWQYWLPVNFPSMPTDSFTLTLITYGVGKSSWNSTFSGDANPADNQSTIIYKNIDLSVKFNNYAPNAVTNNSIIQTAFTITNNGPVALKKGETIYLQARLNGGLYNLALSPGDTTAFTLTADLNVGASLPVNLGVINAIQTTQLLGTDTLQLSVVLHGLKQSKFITSTIFATDGDSTNNITTVTYKPLPTGITGNEYAFGKSVSVYPNPADANVNFHCSDASVQTIVISDLTGKQVKTLAVNAVVTQADLSELHAGTYLYSAYSAAGLVKTDRLVIK